MVGTQTPRPKLRSSSEQPDRADRRGPSASSLALFVMAGAVLSFAIFYDRGPSSSVVVEDSPRPIDLNNEQVRRHIETSVNRHIQLTNRKIETDKEKIKVEAGFAIPRVGMLVGRNNSKDSALDLRTEKSELNPARDLDRRQPPTQPDSPHQIVQAEIADAQERQYAHQEYQKEYARQYVENARRNGYDVRLDGNYRVIDVKKLPPTRVADPTAASGGAFR